MPIISSQLLPLSRNRPAPETKSAIDVLRSVSRALPHAATVDENILIRRCRRMLALHEELEPMLRANLYEFGKDSEGDNAIALFPALDKFMGTISPDGIEAAFETLQSLLGPDEAPLSAEAVPTSGD